ncbi:MAG: 23S rRNA (adenine(2503)-C(2))-methyltransferase RlmN [Slackia sp.]|nr:23S rRNA (adenine(2503)-C(2))-methyltransferase RlmN [Slackia sp.]
MAQSIAAYSYEGICELMKEWGQPRFRAKQIVQWLYQKGVESYDEMSNLPAALKERLQQEAPLQRARIIDKQVSEDGTRKYIVEFADGKSAEMVAIPSGDRLTVCFSTQVGCAMGCIFCATGKEGFTRNLLPGEMVDQILIAQKDMDMRVTNLVGMGQGEPFLNYDNVLAAMRLVNSADGLNVGARKITISTCGILSGIRKFAHEPEQFTMAISLHSAIQKTRDVLMPSMVHQSLTDLKQDIRDYQEASGRRVTYEYVMIDGLNDDDDHLFALVDFCRGTMCHVNLIPINEIEGSVLQPSSEKAVKRFLSELEKRGIEATLRNSRGADIAGACGQLKNMRR